MATTFNAFFSFNIDSFALPRVADFAGAVERPFDGADSDSEIVYFVPDPGFPDDPDESTSTMAVRGHDVSLSVAGIEGHVHEIEVTNPGGMVGWAFYSSGGAEGYEVAAQLYNPADPAGDRALLDYLLSGDTTYQMSAENDTMRCGDGNDLVRDSKGDDRFYGDSGRDTVFGGGGNDRLFGGSGRDTLNGGAGSDRLAGGGGGDTFVFSSAEHSGPAQTDTITDFGRGADVVDLVRIDADTALAGDQAFAAFGAAPAANGLWSDIVTDANGTFTVLYGDVDGDMVADLVIRFSGTVDLQGQIVL